MQIKNTPLVLIILDGWGVAPPTRGNAVTTASTPVMNHLMQDYPTMTLHASSEMVGLPWAEMGNSEVGHITIGCGRVIFQNLPRINRAISTGAFFKNEAFLKAVEHVRKHKSQLHLLGLVSNGGVHSYNEHLYALLEMCKQQSLSKVIVHPILDGRDTSKESGMHFITQLEEKIASIGVGKIASLSGRYYAMDRDNRWDRIEKAYLAIVEGKAEARFSHAHDAITASYAKNIFDEEFIPCVIHDQSEEKNTMLDNDAVIFFNFRSDRARQMTKALILPGFNNFQKPRDVKNILFTTMTEYDKSLPVEVAFPTEKIQNSLAKVLSDFKIHQLHIAETEKYAHVTFFFNGGVEKAYEGEQRILIPSPQVADYSETPHMSAFEITEGLVHEVAGGSFPFSVINFANADMIAHTGKMEPTVIAIEALDKCIGRIVQTVLTMSGTVIITADHGNAEEMLNVQTGNFSKEHSTNPVPFILVNKMWQGKGLGKSSQPYVFLSQQLPKGVLSDIAPTILTIMDLPVPKEMTGTSLI